MIRRDRDRPSDRPRLTWTILIGVTALLVGAFVAVMLVAAPTGQTDTGRARRGAPLQLAPTRGSPSANAPAATTPTPTTPTTTPTSTTPTTTTPTTTTPTTTTPTTTTPTPPPPTRPPVAVLYRPVGCVRRGPAIAYGSGPRRKLVALSFDDGPWTDTPGFVRMLELQHVPATFFMIGRQVTAQYRSTLRRELRDGDALGDHTYTHPDLELLGAGEVRSQLRGTIQAIRGLTGYTPCVFRPPYGDYDESIIEIAKSLGLATILWDVDPSDYTLPGVSAIQQRVLAQVQPGSIILSHDGGGPRGQTLAAYPYIIRTLKQRGYRFETVPQLLGFKTVYRPCIKDCEGVGVKGPLPAGSIVQK